MCPSRRGRSPAALMTSMTWNLSNVSSAMGKFGRSAQWIIYSEKVPLCKSEKATIRKEPFLTSSHPSQFRNIFMPWRMTEDEEFRIFVKSLAKGLWVGKTSFTLCPENEIVLDRHSTLS